MIKMEEIKRELIKKHLEDWTGLKQSSIEHFAQSGKASGSFFMALKDMLDDYDKQLRLHNVSVSLLERAASLVGNPGTNISGSTDMACDEWQKDYERWRNER